MNIKITVVSTKGGVGKTTLTANLGGVLADLGQRVLLVDADPQPTLSSYYRLRLSAPHGLTRLIVDASVEEVISHTQINNLDLIYSDDPDAKVRDWIRDAVDGRVRLKHILSKLDDCYDLILIDTQGAVGPMQDAAVAAADLLLSPIPPEILSAREFVRGTVEMLDRLRPMSYLGAPIGPLRGVIYLPISLRDELTALLYLGVGRNTYKDGTTHIVMSPLDKIAGIDFEQPQVGP